MLPDVLDDQDQSWRIRFVTVDDAVHFVEWDAEGPPLVDGGFRVEAAALTVLTGAALDRLETIHARLVQALGQDRWTYRGGTTANRSSARARWTAELSKALRLRRDRRRGA